MENDKISIIVPVYNVEKCLKDCIESALAQTYHNVELLLIDDGSTDASGEICEEYKKKDSRIKVFHQKNGGASAARNAGLYHCSGEYVAFLDSDDFIAKNYLELLYRNLKRYHADISACHSALFGEGHNFEKAHQMSSGLIVCDDRIDYCRYTFFDHTCEKLFSKKLLEDIKFDVDLVVGEDSLFMACALKKSNLLYLDSQALYMYRMRADSITHTADVEEWRTEPIAWERISKLHAIGSPAYWSAKMRCLIGYRHHFNMDREQLPMLQKKVIQYMPAFWKSHSGFKDKALILLAAYFPSVYFKLYARFKKPPN